MYPASNFFTKVERRCLFRGVVLVIFIISLPEVVKVVFIRGVVVSIGGVVVPVGRVVVSIGRVVVSVGGVVAVVVISAVVPLLVGAVVLRRR